MEAMQIVQDPLHNQIVLEKQVVDGETLLDGSETESSDVLTLGSLYVQDLPNGYILPERPSSFNPKAKFLNDERYFIHDFPPWPLFYIERLKPIQLCLIAGNELPILVRYKPGEQLKKHWRKWLPFFPDADTRDLVTEDTGDSKFVTLYPLQWLARGKHGVDPDVHHKMLNKNTIPEMGASCPIHMSVNDYTVPCMIKASHGLSGRGTYMAKTMNEAEKIIHKLKDEARCFDPSISEVIEELTGNYCVQFYLFKTGEIRWLGCSKQAVTEDFSWNGGYVDWNEQEYLKETFLRTVTPVREYLHKNGYFGVVGIDVLTSKEGHFVVDVNPRINGSTTLLLIAPHMAVKGFPSSALLKIPNIKGNEIEMMEMFDKINSLGEGIVINLASVESPDGRTCEGHVCMFSKTQRGVMDLKSLIINQ
ncbi:uncharacterized protein LOC116303233 [Actinia tenebrosa]|uniref:Uncharacterized protein LOC116303233 n=1 Tax=Actinia tenebrosa TaxID=6105 RepID=A0A6P8IQT4_ACTTE|nr:uncharacterized protein LOC116303233 [Actinia tenebrosa]